MTTTAAAEPLTHDPCPTCRGAGRVIADLRGVGFGEGFMKFMAAGCPVVYEPGTGRMLGHEVVCPHCDGKGSAP